MPHQFTTRIDFSKSFLFFGGVALCICVTRVPLITYLFKKACCLINDLWPTVDGAVDASEGREGSAPHHVQPAHGIGDVAIRRRCRRRLTDVGHVGRAVDDGVVATQLARLVLGILSMQIKF